MATQTNQTSKYDVAVKMLRAKEGVTIEALTKSLKLKKERQARSLLDHLRRRGVKVKRIAPNTFSTPVTKARKAH